VSQAPCAHPIRRLAKSSSCGIVENFAALKELVAEGAVRSDTDTG
jgi:hypothetical protein